MCQLALTEARSRDRPLGRIVEKTEIHISRMNTKLFVGNLSFNATENDLQDAFSQFGAVSEVNIMMDRATNRPRGFAFVTLATPEDAEKAVQGMYGKD